MNSPSIDKQQNEILSLSQIQTINLNALQGFYPIINNIIMTCGVVSIYEIENEINDVDCRGPLFLVETKQKELWLVVLNQSSFGVYRTPINERTQFQQRDRYLTLSHLDQRPLIQFCFVSQSAEEECSNLVNKLRLELNDSARYERIIKQAVTYCST